MLKLTLKDIWKIKLLDSEKKALEKLINITTNRWYELYLFWSRLKSYGADIDIVIKPAPSLHEIIEFESLFNLYTDTKLDLIPYNKKTKVFIENVL